MQVFVKYHAQCPNVAFGGVLLPLQYLQGHVERCTDTGKYHRSISHLSRKPKIADLHILPFQHNVSRFEIPVDDPLPNQCQKSITQLFQHIQGFLFWAFLTAHLDVFCKITVTKLLYDVIILAALHHIVKCYDIIGVQPLEDLDFVFEGGFKILISINWIDDRVLLSFESILTATY